MSACACAWTCPYTRAPAGRDVSPLCLVSVNVSMASQAWSCDRSADEPLLPHPLLPPLTLFPPLVSPLASLPSAQGLNILYCPGITSGIWNFYLITGQNLSVTGARAMMHHKARRCPVGTAGVAERISGDNSVQQAPHRRHTCDWKPQYHSNTLQLWHVA